MTPERASVDKMKCIGDLLAIPRPGSNERQFGRILTSSHPRTRPTAHVNTNSYVGIFGHEFCVGLPPHHTTRLHHENGLIVGAKTEGKPPIIFNQTTSGSSLGWVELICGLRIQLEVICQIGTFSRMPPTVSAAARKEERKPQNGAAALPS